MKILVLNKIKLLLLVLTIFPRRLLVNGLYDEPCNYTFFCERDYLLALGSSRAFSDSKTIVDLVMKDDFSKFKRQFDAELFATGVLNDPKKVREIVYKYFNNPGDELVTVTPEDWTPDPFGDKIQDPQLKAYALTLNSLWKNLTRKASDDFDEVSSRSTFLSMPYETIVPGGRFTEIYYWDSYWTIQGLLACQMNVTARHMIQNLMAYVERYGFVPNGGRVYYTTRSQPPFLTLMANDYFRQTNDLEFIRQNLHVLDREYQFWVKNRRVRVEVDGQEHYLFQYRTNMAYERPESFYEDYKTAERGYLYANRAPSQVFIDLSSAAESGWDFSSRWLAYTGPHMSQLYSIRTTRIVPVCLNSILYKVACTLSELHTLVDSGGALAQYYTDQASDLEASINSVLWNDESQTWFDFDLDSRSHHKQLFVSNLYPLWAGCHKLTPDQITTMLTHLNNSGYLDMAGGFPTSNIFVNQQWDSPNAWAPLQDILIEGFLNLNQEAGTAAAMELMRKWVRNNYNTYMERGHMYEKYSAIRQGYPGEGGEYNVQVGFGWSNGVALKYLERYGRVLTV